MSTRVLSLIAVCVALALGIWWMTSPDRPSELGGQVANSEEVTTQAASSPGLAPPAVPTATPGQPEPSVPPAADPKRGSAVAPLPVTAAPSTAPPPASRGASAPVPSQAPTSAAPMIAPPAPAPAEAPSLDAALSLDKVNLSLRDYRTIMKENPVGTNAEITRALNGGNPKRAVLIQEGLVINADGNLVDPWGTPYFFHQLSKDHMEIHSAGPDRQFGTSDDSISN